MIRILIALALSALACFGAAPAGSFRQVQAPPAAGGGPTTLFTDAFTRADDTNPGANWTEGTGGGDISSNRLRMGNGGATPALVVTAAAAHADTADVTVKVVMASASGDGGPVARCTETDGTPTMYAVDCNAGTVTVHRYNNSATGTDIGNVAQTLSANATVELQVSGTGATVTIKVWYNTSLILNFTDTTGSRLTTAGRPGIHNWTNGGTTERDYDDFTVTTP